MSIDVGGVITTAGRTTLIDADNAGLTLRLRWIAFGAGTTEHDETSTALVDERTRAEIMSAARIDPSTLEIGALFDDDTEFRVREIGVFADDGSPEGLLFAVVWQVAGLFEKSAPVNYPYQFQLPIAALPVDAISFDEDVVLNLDLAFVGPIAALAASMARLTQTQIEQDIRLRVREGRATGGMEAAI